MTKPRTNNSIKPVPNSTLTAIEGSISLESYTHTLSCIRNSHFNLTTLRNLAKVLLVNGFSTGSKKKRKKDDISLHMQSLPLFHPCFSSLHITGNDEYNKSNIMQIQIGPIVMDHAELNEDFMALKTWFNAADSPLKSRDYELGHERFYSTSSQRNKDSFPLQESSEHKTQIFASSGKEISDEEVIVSPGESSSAFPTSNSLLQSDVISLRGEAMNYNEADMSVKLLPAIANLLPVSRSEFSTSSRNDPLELRSSDSLESRTINSLQPPCRNAPMNASSRSDQLSSLTRNVSSLSSSSRNGNYSLTSSSRNDPLTSSIRNDPLTSSITKDPLPSSIRNDSLTSLIGNAPLTSLIGNAPLTSLIGNAPLTSIGNAPLTLSATNNDPVTFSMRNVRLTSSIGNNISTFSSENAPLTSTDRNDLLTCSIRNTTPSTRDAPLTALIRNAPLTSSATPLTSSVRNDPLTSKNNSLDHVAETAASKGFVKEMKSCAVSDEQFCSMGNHSSELINDVIEETTKSSCFLQEFSASAINSVKSVIITSENRASASFLQEMNGGIVANSKNNHASESLDLLSRWENRMKNQEINAEININKVMSNTNLCPLPKNLQRKRKWQLMSRLVIGTRDEKGDETINDNSCHKSRSNM